MIHEKLEGIPPIYYLNLDESVDRKDYMESQFKLLGIQNYTRVSASRYHPSNFDIWKDDLIFDEILNEKQCLSILRNQLQSIIDWYYSEVSETCLILEDDLCFSLINYWNFDWKTMITYLPCNWDCIQFHIIGEGYIQMGFNKRSRYNHGATCYMITRTYVEKLMKMHYIGGKFKLYNNYYYDSTWPTYHYQSADFVPYEIGITYSFPIFITNYRFKSDRNNEVNQQAKSSDIIVSNWWSNESQNYSLEDLFGINKIDRKKLIYKL